MLGFTYLALGGVISPYRELGLAPKRLPWWILCAALTLPYFAATEFLLRGRGGAGVWLPIAGKLLTLLALALGSGLGLLPRHTQGPARMRASAEPEKAINPIMTICQPISASSKMNLNLL